MPPGSSKPTGAEIAILRVLWARGPATVREVHHELCRTHPTGYTTTLKLLQIMSDKGLVSRDETERAHVYRAISSEEHTQLGLISDLMDKAFGGSAQKLVLRALSTHKSSPEELAEIRRLLDALEGER